ncbi:MAG: DsrE family protein [Betaproteobacteria bacterium]
MKNLFILNDAPYGTERSYNGVRLAGSLSKVKGEEVKVFLMGDAAACAKGGQKVPEGFYNLQLMLGRVVRSGAQIGVCGTCMDARGITEAELMEGAHKSTLAELTTWTQSADKVMVF